MRKTIEMLRLNKKKLKHVMLNLLKKPSLYDIRDNFHINIIHFFIILLP